MSDPTICKNCKFHRAIYQNTACADAWYNHTCAAVEREPAVDYVTGARGFLARNDLGTVYVTDREFEYCRDINTNGNCEYYSPASMKNRNCL
jgi:hypothetical protein